MCLSGIRLHNDRAPARQSARLTASTSTVPSATVLSSYDIQFGLSAPDVHTSPFRQYVSLVCWFSMTFSVDTEATTLTYVRSVVVNTMMGIRGRS